MLVDAGGYYASMHRMVDCSVVGKKSRSEVLSCPSVFTTTVG